MKPEFIHHNPPRVYTKACVVDDLIFLAGEDSKDPVTQEVRGKTVAEQTEITLMNLKATLESLGSSLANVIKVTAYLKDPRYRAEYSGTRSKFLSHAPAHTLITGVKLAEPEMLVELDAIAVIPGKREAPVFIPHVPPRVYSKACVYGDYIFLAGEDSKEPATQKVLGDTVAEQTKITFENMKTTLESLGSSLEKVVKVVVYLKDARYRSDYQVARRSYLPQVPPGTLIMNVFLAEPEMLVEVDAIALR
jgi:enamine deaminase RidA (YjgF/YER057c/UK114 family)